MWSGATRSSSSRVGNRPSFSRVGNAYRATIHVPFGWTLARSAKYFMHVGERVERRDRVVLLAVRRAERMDVAVIEAGQECLAAGVDDPRRRAGVAGDLGVRADGQHAIAADGHGLGDPGIAVDRDHPGVADDQVGRGGLVGAEGRSICTGLP